MNNTDRVINEALRSPLAAADQSLSAYALSQTSWNAIKSVFTK